VFVRVEIVLPALSAFRRRAKGFRRRAAHYGGTSRRQGYGLASKMADTVKWPRTRATCLGEARGEDGSTVQGAAVNGEWPEDWMALPDAATCHAKARRATAEAPRSRSGRIAAAGKRVVESLWGAC
jgi:hypothetical protein